METSVAVYKVAEVAALLAMGRRQTYEAIARGEIPCHRIGNSVRCSKVAIHAWLDGTERREGGPVDLALNETKAAKNGLGGLHPEAVMAQVH